MLSFETPLLSQLLHCQHCGRLGHSRLRDGNRVLLQGFIRVADLQSLTYAAEKAASIAGGETVEQLEVRLHTQTVLCWSQASMQSLCPDRARNRLNEAHALAEPQAC